MGRSVYPDFLAEDGKIFQRKSTRGTDCDPCYFYMDDYCARGDTRDEKMCMEKVGDTTSDYYHWELTRRRE